MPSPALSQLLRSLRLSHIADRLRYFYQIISRSGANRAFRLQHPDIALPDDYLMYESFQLNYEKYFTGGQKTAAWVLGFFEKYTSLQGAHILDWGCGPGRVIRHLPALLEGKNAHISGTDYNPRSIAWCRANLPGIRFEQNQLNPPLVFPDASFEAIYGISIFTHLSEKAHREWAAELMRVLKPGGILMVTLQGNAFSAKLTPPELAQYHSGALVVRGHVKEGHRVYSAFHPDAYVKRLFEKGTILEHVAGKPQDGWIEQDVWVIQKR